MELKYENNYTLVEFLETDPIFIYNAVVGDSQTTGRHSEHDSLIILKTSAIKSIKDYNHGRGAIRGLTIGLISGLIANLNQQRYWPSEDSGAGFWPLFEFMYIPVIGAGVGLMIGWIIGERDTYYLNADNK